MPKTREIKFRVTALQHEIIKNKAQVEGYNSFSSFVRYKIGIRKAGKFEEVDEIEKMIREIHKMVFSISDKLRKNNESRKN